MRNKLINVLFVFTLVSALTGVGICYLFNTSPQALPPGHPVGQAILTGVHVLSPWLFCMLSLFSMALSLSLILSPVLDARDAALLARKEAAKKLRSV